jgi:hypothetical protein
MPHTIYRKWAIALGALLAFPTAYFIFISILKYGLGLPNLFDISQPLFKRVGIKQSPGLNINLLILFGPFIAMILNLFSVLRIEWFNEKEVFSLKISLEKHWWNIMLVFFSFLLLSVLFFYAVGENCHC